MRLDHLLSKENRKAKATVQPRKELVLLAEKSVDFDRRSEVTERLGAGARQLKS